MHNHNRCARLCKGVNMLNQWSYEHKSCVSCNSTRKPHKGNGLCTTCYYRAYKRPNPPNRRPKQPTTNPTDSFDEGYESGLYKGRSQVANAISSALDSHGVRCSISDNYLYLHIPTGKTYEINLDDDLF